MKLRLETPVTELSGIGAARAALLGKLGIGTVRDLLQHYPREYEDRRESFTISEAPEGRPICVAAMAAEAPRMSRIRKGLDITRVRVVDGRGSMAVSFFNQSYLRDAIRPGESYVFYGRVEGTGRTRQMTNPVFEPKINDGSLDALCPSIR